MNDRVGARTQDRLIKSQVLYQLSYAIEKRHILPKQTPFEGYLANNSFCYRGYYMKGTRDAVILILTLSVFKTSLVLVR